jgi:putative oxidoreductase
MFRVLDLRFVPASLDLALFLLRVWFGLSLVALHGWGKLVSYPERMHRFADPFGIGAPASLALAVFAEVVCASLLALGLFTRFAALACIINMSTAFFYAHGGRLTGEGNGELAFMYLGGFVALFLAGPGRHSLDARRGVRY